MYSHIYNPIYLMVILIPYLYPLMVHNPTYSPPSKHALNVPGEIYWISGRPMLGL
jgi:hypothetical protein